MIYYTPSKEKYHHLSLVALNPPRLVGTVCRSCVSHVAIEVEGLLQYYIQATRYYPTTLRGVLSFSNGQSEVA